jgi:hypothetical protein
VASGGPYLLWQWGNNPGFQAFAMISASTSMKHHTRNGFVLFTNSERAMPLAASLAHSNGAFRFHMLG